ncbi:MAG: hypothetical protein ACFFCS_16665 [Candidatus Hodarchaeota archaeon]
MVTIAFIGAAGRVNTTCIAQFPRFKESSGIDMALYDINKEGMEDTRKIVQHGMELKDVYFNLEISDSMEDAINGADLILFCATYVEPVDPPFNLSDEFRNVALMEEVIKTAGRVTNNCPIINFANPTDKLAMMVKTLHPDVRITSLCTGPEEFKRTIMMLLDIPLEDETDVDIEWIGCNHYGFVPGMRIRGEDGIEILKEKVNYDWRNFRGLRIGDSYDLATNLSLLGKSGVLTVPLGHVNYFQKGVPLVMGSQRFRPTKEILLDYGTGEDEESTPELYWELMDSWGTRQVAMAALSITRKADLEFFMQAPNDGYIPELEDRAFIETPGRYKNGKFARKQFDIPFIARKCVVQEALGRWLVCEAIAEFNYEKLLQALMFRNNRPMSLPIYRKIISEKWGIEENLEDLYNIPDKEYEFTF